MRWSVIVRDFCRAYPAASPLEVLRMPNYQREHLFAAACGRYDPVAGDDHSVEAATARRDRAIFEAQRIKRQRGGA